MMARGMILMTFATLAATVPQAVAQEIDVRPGVENLLMAARLSRLDPDGAAELYLQVISEAGADSSVRAEALFGWASVTGRLEDSLAVDERVDHYLLAVSLDSARYFVPANNNAAQVASKGGEHAQAARLYSRAGEADHPAQSFILADAGEEFERAGEPDSALRAYRRAVTADATNLAALSSFTGLVEKTGDYEALLAIAGAAGDAGSAGREIVADALVGVMADPDASPGQVDSALVLFAGTVARLAIGPEHFASRYRGRLVAVTRRREHPGVRQLVLAYADPPEETALPSWWRVGLARAATWSTTLRRLGDWYVDADLPETARRYYLAALTYPDRVITQPWADLDALLPLARIYVDREDFSELRDWLFDQKNMLYGELRNGRPEAIPFIRRLHRSLGLMFAMRKIWGDGLFDYYGAAFQLSRMREFTLSMQREGIAVRDPPELLEQLVYAYFAVGAEDRGRRLIPEVIEGYAKRGDVRSARRVERIMSNRALIDSVIGGE